MDTRLRAATDSHFSWMLGVTASPDDLVLPPGGVDARDVIAKLRVLATSVRSHCAIGSWLIVSGNEVVGLCGYKDLPRDGVVEIGYGIAVNHRRLGHATRAIAAVLIEIAEDATIHDVIAETARSNVDSQRVLQKNGFVRIGSRMDPEEGELLRWRKSLRRHPRNLLSP